MFGIFEIFCNLPKIEIPCDACDVFVCIYASDKHCAIYIRMCRVEK